MAKRQPGISVRDLYGGRFLGPQAIRRSRAELEKRLMGQFRERTVRRAELREQMKKIRAPLLELSKDKRAADGIQGLRRLQREAGKRKVPLPQRKEVTGGIFTGSIAATVVPPYDYQWTWNAVSGSPDSNSQSANKNSGQMSMNIQTDNSGGTATAVSAAAAVGVYFYPPAAGLLPGPPGYRVGLLQIWASPAFNDGWGDWCSFDSAHADGWIGLYVGCYDLEGAPAGTLVDQQISLWSDDSWWSGVGWQQGSNSAYGLNAVLPVDQQHQYEIWVWCGGDVSGAGWGDFSGSGAQDTLNVTVPSITWEVV